MMGVKPQEPDYSEFVEVDPTGRYGRYNEILGKGSSKIVYRAFDEYEGVEVAWNQVKLYSFLQSPEDLERLYCEIHLLKTLKHKNIMKFYTSWVDTSKRNINFITEMFTSGTLRQYRQKHKRVNIRAVKHWCRQILSGLLYLHSHDPPVIHRDLKCDNIFVNGNQGVVKIGDLGLAAILRKSHAAHCVGTPEFMAPEVYEEEYNELVDIYSFGMCVLEMVTFEYPYSECIHPAHIYKKVISGTMPEALYKVEDPEVRQFVEKCLVTASKRLPARELMKDPFLQIEENGSGCSEEDIFRMDSIVSQPSIDMLHSNGSLRSSDFSGDFENDLESALGRDYGAIKLETEDIDLFNNQADEYFPNLDITIRGRRKEDGRIFLRLRIEDRDGRVRNIYFPFDIEADTALSVATEMVAELDITDFEVTRIAEMIDSEVSLLVPEWMPGPGFEEVSGDPSTAMCHTCTSNVSSCGSFLDFFKSKIPGCSNHKSVQCLECASMHGRFEEITYRTEESEQCTTKDAVTLSTGLSDCLQSYSIESEVSHSHQEGGQLDHSDKDERKIHVEGHVGIGPGISDGDAQKHHFEMSKLEYQDLLHSLSDDYENEIQEEFRSLKAIYQMEPSEYKKQQLAGLRRVLHQSLDFSSREPILENGVSGSLNHSPSEKSNHRRMKSFHLGTHFSFPIPTVDVNTSPNANNCSSNHPNKEAQRAQRCEVNHEMSPKSMLTARSFREGIRRPLARTRSLLAEVVDCLKL